MYTQGDFTITVLFGKYLKKLLTFKVSAGLIPYPPISLDRAIKKIISVEGFLVKQPASFLVQLSS